MAELGWLGLQIPEEYEGLGLGFFDLCVVLEQTGRELMPEPFISTLLLGAQALLLGGTASQKRELLPGVSAGAHGPIPDRIRQGLSTVGARHRDPDLSDLSVVRVSRWPRTSEQG